MTKSKNTYKNLWLPVVLLLTVMIIDYFTPLYVAVGVLYSSVILVSLRESRIRIMVFAIIATSFIVINFLYFNNIVETTHWIFPINRLTSLIGLWVTTIIALNYKQVAGKLLKERTDYAETLEEIIFANSHKVRKPLANIVKLVELMEDEQTSENEIREMLPLLGQSAAELDEVTREMTDAISSKEYNRNLLSPSI